MGKIHSKQVCKRTAPEGECFLVNTKVTSVKDLVAAISAGNSLSEAFVELAGSKQMPDHVTGRHDNTTIELTDFMQYCRKPDSGATLLDPHLLNIPLRVTLPPLNRESDLLKLFNVDRKKECSDSIQTDTTDNNHGSEKTDLSLDKECEVTVEAESQPELQEWLFTLYDFDDLGKITKEDIAGLLKSLYDTVGSVIALQQQGTRVLKLHLTVTPGEKPKCPTTAACGAEKLNKQDQTCADGTRINESQQTTSRPAPPLPTGGHLGTTPTKKASRSKCQPTSSLLQDFSRTPHHNKRTVCCKEKRFDVSVNSPERIKSKDDDDLFIMRRMSFSGGFRDAVSSAAATAGDTTPCVNTRRRHIQRQHCSNTSRKLSQFDERHLAHLIQQNMNLNDQHPHHPRKTRRHQSIFVNRTFTEDPFSNRPCTTEETKDYTSEESAQRRNYYLDLAGIENYSPSHTCDVTYAQPDCGIYGDFDANPKSHKSVHAKSKPSSSNVRNFARCNSGRTDAHGAETVCNKEEIVMSNGFVTEKHESDFVNSPAALNVPKSNHPANNGVETVSSSHYHRRHRHREKNQSRAMKQVAEWIEKEHVYHKSEKRVVVVQRHEHHHVHEHFHHHFHHCNNS